MDEKQMTNSTDLMHDDTLVLVSISLFVHAPVELDQREDVLERVARKLRDAAKQVVDTDTAVEAVGVTSYRYPEMKTRTLIDARVVGAGQRIGTCRR